MKGEKRQRRRVEPSCDDEEKMEDDRMSLFVGWVGDIGLRFGSMVMGSSSIRVGSRYSTNSSSDSVWVPIYLFI